MFTLGAFAIIFDENGSVLLSHRCDMDVWNLPGCMVESREMPDEAVVREVREETGLEVVVERLVGVYGKVDRDEINFSFVCRVVGGQLTLTDEADQHRFFARRPAPGQYRAEACRAHSRCTERRRPSHLPPPDRAVCADCDWESLTAARLNHCSAEWAEPLRQHPFQRFI